jgi:hypothetical protein
MRRISLALGCFVIALACPASLAATQAPTRDSITEKANAASGGPSGVVSKKKCSKARWRCAPKQYKLFAVGTVKWSTGSESFRARVNLGRQRAGRGGVIYTTEIGKVAVSASYTAHFLDALPSCESDIRVDVPEQRIFVGRGGLVGPNDFLAYFDQSGPDKNTYALHAGSIQPDPSTVEPAVATLTCLEDGSVATQDFYFFGSNRLNTARRGKVGDPVLSGRAATGGASLKWVLTTHRSCGKACSILR